MYPPDPQGSKPVIYAPDEPMILSFGSKMMNFPSAIQGRQPYFLRVKKKMKIWFQLVYEALLFIFC